MALKLFKYILVISNLLLIALIVFGITLSYFFIQPEIKRNLDSSLALVTIAFALWGVALSLTSVCFIGIVYSRIVCLHFTAALILCLPLALSVWITVEQFLFQEKLNYFIVGISITASVIWFVQIISELCLACIICCNPNAFEEIDGEKGAGGDEKNEYGSDEEKEKLVIMANENSPNKKKLDGDDQNNDEVDEIENEKDYRDSVLDGRGLQGKFIDVRPIDEDAETNSPSPDYGQGKGRQPPELPLKPIPEERQHLLA